MGDLRLGKLTVRTPVRITISISPALNQSLAEICSLLRKHLRRRRTSHQADRGDARRFPGKRQSVHPLAPGSKKPA